MLGIFWKMKWQQRILWTIKFKFPLFFLFLIFNIHLLKSVVSSSKSSLFVGIPVCLNFFVSKFEKQIKKNKQNRIRTCYNFPSFLFVTVCVCVRACVRACVRRACVRACVCVVPWHFGSSSDRLFCAFSFLLDTLALSIFFILRDRRLGALMLLSKHWTRLRRSPFPPPVEILGVKRCFKRHYLFTIVLSL